MAGVSPPSDGGYNYFQRTITDLEDDLKNEAKRNQSTLPRANSRSKKVKKRPETQRSGHGRDGK